MSEAPNGRSLPHRAHTAYSRERLYKVELEHIFQRSLERNAVESTRSTCSETILRYLERINGASLAASDVLGLYVTEIWNFEQAMHDGDSLEVVQQVLRQDVDLDELAALARKTHKQRFKHASDEVVHHQLRKVLNIRNACELGLFSAAAAASRPVLTVGLAHQIHRVLMSGLMEDKDCGTFRTADGKARGNLTMYVAHYRIEHRLRGLFEVVNGLGLNRETIDPIRALVIGAVFLEHFLLIHPYRNGNGRVARLRFSILVQGHAPVPLGLQKHVGKSYDESRAAYLRALERSRTDDAPHRQAIVTYVLFAVRSYLYDLFWSYAL